MRLHTINKSIKRRIDPDPVSEDTQNTAEFGFGFGFGSGLVVNLQVALEGSNANTNRTNTRLLH